MTPQEKYLRLEVYKHHPAPHHRLIARAAHRFNADPAWQYRFHVVSTYVWIANWFAATLVFFLAQGFWQHFATYYLVSISLAACAQTEYGAVPAAQAAIHAKAVHEREQE